MLKGLLFVTFIIMASKDLKTKNKINLKFFKRLLICDMIITALFIVAVFYLIYSSYLYPQNEAALGAFLGSYALFTILIIPLAVFNIIYSIIFFWRNRIQGKGRLLAYLLFFSWIILPLIFYYLINLPFSMMGISNTQPPVF